MSRPRLKELKLLNFLRLQSERRRVVDASSDSNLPRTESYAANALAASLHPHVQHLVVARITDEAPGVRSYILKPAECPADQLRVSPENHGRPVCPAYFTAGQYLSIRLQIAGSCLTRPYSISSSPRDSLDGYYRITVKRGEDGFASHFIHDTWKEGTPVTASAPLGTFTYDRLRDARHVIAIAGGSGITPFRSLAGAVADGDEDCFLTIIYGAASMEDIIFKSELEELAASCERIRLVYVLSGTDGADEIHTDPGIYKVEYGFITAEIIRRYMTADEDASFFLCGPPAMYDFVGRELESLGIRKKFIRSEVFQTAGPIQADNSPASSDAELSDPARFTLTVHMAGGIYSVPCSPEESLLVSMERAGLPAPSRCRAGACGWCRSLLIAGDVYIPESTDSRRMADRKYGYIHPCVTFPLGDIILETDPDK